MGKQRHGFLAASSSTSIAAGELSGFPRRSLNEAEERKAGPQLAACLNPRSKTREREEGLRGGRGFGCIWLTNDGSKRLKDVAPGRVGLTRSIVVY